MIRSKLKRGIALIGLSLVAANALAQIATCPSWGPYIAGKNLGSKNGLLLMCDVKGNNTDQPTYWSTISFSLGGRGGYCGIQRTANRNNIFSVWDSVDNNNSHECYAEYWRPDVNVTGFQGEGTGLHTDCNFGWVPGQWYTTAVRRWYNGDGKTRIGFFMYDNTKHEWSHYVTAVTPEQDAYFLDNAVSGFLEKFSGTTETRYGEWTNWWKLNSDGTWNKATQSESSAGTGSWSTAQVSSSVTSVSSCGTTAGMPTTTYNVSLSQQSNGTPLINLPCSVMSAASTYNLNTGKMISAWKIDSSTVPQLNYTLKIYDNSARTGTPVYTSSLVPKPQYRGDTATVANLSGGTYYASLVIVDIFNNTTTYNYSFTAAGACNANIAQGKAASASSVEAGTSWNPALAVDGNSTSTRWSSAYTDNSWFQVDLGSISNICKVALKWEAAYGKNYNIQVSNDGATWTTVQTVTNNTVAGSYLTYSFANVSGRYVRMQGMARGSGYGYSLYEFEVYGVNCTSPAIAAQPVSQSSCSGTNNGLQYSVAATGTGTTLSYLWQYSDNSGASFASLPSSYPGYNANTLTTNGNESNGRQYRCQVSNGCGAVYSNPATFTLVTGNTGSGLKGSYYSSVTLPASSIPATSPSLTRTDTAVNFDWGNGAPATGVTADNFMVRWTGKVEAPATGSYVFAVNGDDGYRLWVNGQQVIDKWIDQGTTETLSANMPLTGCAHYDIKLEYYENGGGAVCQLKWKVPGSSTLAAIPKGRLFAAGTVGAKMAQSVSAAGQRGAAYAYPNPASSELNLEYDAVSNDEPVLITLADQSGRVVASQNKSSVAGINTGTLDIRSLPAAMYLLKIQVGNKAPEAMKIMVRH